MRYSRPGDTDQLRPDDSTTVTGAHA
jgi:hypothetical protein